MEVGFSITWTHSNNDKSVFSHLVRAFDKENDDETVVAKLKAVLDDNEDVNVDDFGMNYKSDKLLHKATQDGRLGVVSYLLEVRGASVNASNRFGGTVLQTAARYGCLEIAKLLIQHGADIHAANDDGQTALVLALEADEFDEEVVSFFLDQKGLSLDALDAEGRTPFLVACQYAPANIVQRMIDLGANPLEQEKLLPEGLTTIHLCSSQNPDPKVLQVLMDSGTLPVEHHLHRQEAEEGNTPLHCASTAAHARMLFERDEATEQMLDATNYNDETPLQMARNEVEDEEAESDRTDVLQYLQLIEDFRNKRDRFGRFVDQQMEIANNRNRGDVKDKSKAPNFGALLFTIVHSELAGTAAEGTVVAFHCLRKTVAKWTKDYEANQ